MIYEGTIYRPPSEANSLLIQVTIGCSHNKCTFCANYKGKQFRVRKMEEILADLAECGAKYKKYVRRIFLCDGNALVMRTEQLRQILIAIRELFPLCERVGVYASAGDILRKSVEELRELRELGLSIYYIGLESGSDKVLEQVNKGATAAEMIRAAQAAREAGVTTSVMAITGLGGPELWEEHANETARVLNEMQPDYVGLLALMVEQGTVLHDQVKSGQFTLLTPKQIVEEMYLMVKGLELNDCFFSSIHASNYINLRGQLPGDKDRLMQELEYYRRNERAYKREEYRAL